ncbi:Enoyl-CoA hydratase [Nocardia seriolae]|uniref:Enoyl-CoA hydratase n=2 Tax=Nocardia seriolae TaxID=37332 RepID=A0ABC8AVN2_9NOCA|nr:enoyl-CoA hydratase/isomerase family protein [Nocardia seriolae]APA98089.1 Enoyl-CoA hydratase [Nocardia seriolae]OJF80049.1 enoyl-CoA hydratase [Nocardia seriolae]PSK28939.1 enoyl-CoA hydratase/isomerase family protein [Nocardia seriolae]QOW36010.1 enoyl-CoA hydratase/isomerase family protein [Nocardia seriolae]QUN16492.1 enoyl-CoA hydratase/isomerase family protein [Nocardia seriolae]
MTENHGRAAQGSAETDPVLLEMIPGGVARIRLNRPDASNGMDVPFLRALHATVMTCHGDPAVRAVLITGEGKNFCAGGDIRVFAAKGEALPDYLREATSWLQIAISALLELQVPVISAVHGFAAGGGGFGLVCASDFVIAAESDRFMSGAVRVGMAPDAGVSVTLTQLVGLRKAMEILLTNPTLTAAEALDLGLLTKVVPDDALEAEALTYARQFTDMAPKAVAAVKRLVWGGVGASVPERLAEEARTVAELSGTQDSLEGLVAVLEHRAPRFVGK